MRRCLVVACQAGALVYKLQLPSARDGDIAKALARVSPISSAKLAVPQLGAAIAWVPSDIRVASERASQLSPCVVFVDDRARCTVLSLFDLTELFSAPLRPGTMGVGEGLRHMQVSSTGDAFAVTASRAIYRFAAYSAEGVPAADDLSRSHYSFGGLGTESAGGKR